MTFDCENIFPLGNKPSAHLYANSCQSFIGHHDDNWHHSLGRSASWKFFLSVVSPHLCVVERKIWKIILPLAGLSISFAVLWLKIDPAPFQFRNFEKRSPTHWCASIRILKEQQWNSKSLVHIAGMKRRIVQYISQHSS